MQKASAPTWPFRLRYLAALIGLFLLINLLVDLGYGLIDPVSQGLRRRPSYGALQRLGEELAGLAWRRQLGDDPAVRLHEIAAGGQRRVVGWVLDGASGSRYHGPVRAARTRDGIALRPRGGGWPLTGQPAYFDLED